MPEILEAALVRSGTYGSLWLDGELVAECYGCQAKLNKTKEDVPRCRTLIAGKKMTGLSGTGTVRIYNATSRLITAESDALKSGKDLRLPFRHIPLRRPRRPAPHPPRTALRR